MIGVRGPTPLWPVLPWTGSSGNLRTHAEQATENKPVSSTSPRPILQLLPPVSCQSSFLIAFHDTVWHGSISRTIPFLPKVLVVRTLFITEQKPKTLRNMKNLQGSCEGQLRQTKHLPHNDLEIVHRLYHYFTNAPKRKGTHTLKGGSENRSSAHDLTE